MSHKTPSIIPPAEQALPLVVQVGFAGARTLYDRKRHPGISAVEFEKAVDRQFPEILSRELKSLGLGPQLFLCGVSSLAIGGDALFTRACRDLVILQCVLLPQPREEFLTAVSSDGPDFTDEQRDAARQLLKCPHVIQERVVSDAAKRQDRFRDVNLEMVRVCDVLVCLMWEGQAEKPGGSREVIRLAARRKRPVLEIQIAIQDDAPVLTSKWHNREDFQRPSLPTDIASAALPEGTERDPYAKIEDYIRGLKDFASGHANWGRKHFTAAALLIILAHVFATVFAVLALKLHGGVIVSLLIAELLLLATGFGIHQYLHATHRVQRWAMARLAAEVARSVSSVGRLHLYPEYLFTLPFPSSLRPLLRTINVLHLQSTRPWISEPWSGVGERNRDEYVRTRLTSPERKSQIPYNEETYETSGRRLTIARWTFLTASATAFVATLIKLLCTADWFATANEAVETLKTVLGILAVVIPVIAVAALSVASAFDLEARRTNSKEMKEFLVEQKVLLENAYSTREYSRLVLETEFRLLGETVNWYARRTFLGVA